MVAAVELSLVSIWKSVDFRTLALDFVWQDMREHFLAPETVSCNAALCAYEQAGRWEDALALLQDMRELRPKL